MKYFQLTVVLVVFVVVAALAKKTDDEEWEDFKVLIRLMDLSFMQFNLLWLTQKKHGKKHKGAKEEAKRKGLFLGVHRKIKEHNSKANQPFQMGHNEFSDWVGCCESLLLNTRFNCRLFCRLPKRSRPWLEGRVIKSDTLSQLT